MDDIREQERDWADNLIHYNRRNFFVGTTPVQMGSESLILCSMYKTVCFTPRIMSNQINLQASRRYSKQPSHGGEKVAFV